MTQVINFVGGPCCGKSTVAAHLFALMKLEGYKVELLPEFAKQLVYSNDSKAMNDQLFITATQNHLLNNLQGEVDYVITDTSLINGVVYETYYQQEDSLLSKLALSLYLSYDNTTFLLPRKKSYDSYGRSQTEDQAKNIDSLFREVLGGYELDYFDLTNLENHSTIASHILEKYLFKGKI